MRGKSKLLLFAATLIILTLLYGGETKKYSTDEKNPGKQKKQSRFSTPQREIMQTESLNSKKQIRVDKDDCISCGECIDVCPDLFQWSKDGKAEAMNKDGCSGCDCEEAADACPTDAILLEEK